MKEINNNDEQVMKQYAKAMDMMIDAIIKPILLPDNKDVTTNISRKENKDESFKDDKDKMSDV
tara:strand:+ start:1138 stop:1326 length:189 start_codon:yes stop_codon:yes gene_type:complete